MKMRGFTLIELMIVVAIVGIIAAIAIPVIQGKPINGSQTVTSVGINGVVETRCISGMQFVVGGNGEARQIYDTLGHGVACEAKPATEQAVTPGS